MGEPKLSNKMTFEEAFAKLEEITAVLEKGNLGLEATIKAFEEGRGLLDYCEKLLGNAEKALELMYLQEDPKGE